LNGSSELPRRRANPGRPQKRAEARRKLVSRQVFIYSPAAMRGTAEILLVLSAALLAAGPSAARRPPPLRDPVLVRIGMICRWDRACMQAQQGAMAAALHYVDRKSPPARRIRACNRNAARGADRTDWVGFYNCIRNRRIGR
jgi:hypothetical protein